MNFRRHRRKINEMKEVFAAIDLGTNSCRLLVCRFDGKIRIIDSFSKVVRLGENIQTTGELSEDAIDRSLKALKVCVDKVHHNRVTHLRAVTTEACRRTVNGHILVERARDELGLNLEIISSEEEALLALAGCSGVFQNNIPYGIAFDIGGGSTEVMWTSISEEAPNFKIIDWISLPYGVVTLSDEYGTHSTSPRIYEQIHTKVTADLKKFADNNNIHHHIQEKQVQMIGTSGTITTLAAIHLNLSRYDRHVIDGIYLRTVDAKNITQSLLHMPLKQRNAHACIGVGRSDLVITGSAILEGILNTFDVPWLRVADRGVREGILVDLIRNCRTTV